MKILRKNRFSEKCSYSYKQYENIHIVHKIYICDRSNTSNLSFQLHHHDENMTATRNLI